MMTTEHTIEPTHGTANDDLAECAYCGDEIEWMGYFWLHTEDED